MEWSPISSPCLVCPCYIKISSILHLPVAPYGENIASYGAIQWGGTFYVWTHCFPIQSSPFLILFHALYVPLFNHIEKTKFQTIVQPTVPHGTPTVPHGTLGVLYGTLSKIWPLIMNSAARHTFCTAWYILCAARHTFSNLNFKLNFLHKQFDKMIFPF